MDEDILKEMGIHVRQSQGDIQELPGRVYLVNVTNAELASLKVPAGYTLEPLIVEANNPYYPGSQLFPYYDTAHHWSVDLSLIHI